MSDFKNQSPWGSPPGGGNGGFRRGPTPPLALEIAIVNLVPLIGFFTKVLDLIPAPIVDFLSSINVTYLVFIYKDTI